ncbi:MAG TPA: hydroxymethylglutaryl-CoA synthase [Microbacteriaceae bacterium]|nr:hydroxymethylglutaryl-CoA synthase [Microbacteriaceae bacterium]
MTANVSEAAIGIHDLALATGHHVLDLRQLAEHNGSEVDKYYIGIGQSQMSVAAEDEDVVTLGASAARRLLDRRADGAGHPVRTLLFATESGIDQSKSAGVYVHRLLGLDPACRVVELKQACYSATAALQFALGLVARDRRESVLVIAADVARYPLDSPGEATQGAAAAAFLVGADPALVAIEPATGLHTDDVHDFWRPNDRSEAIVDGKRSLGSYLRSLEGSWLDYRGRGGVDFEAIDRFCYHQPFTKMARKAHDRLCRIVGAALGPEDRARQLGASLELNRRLGNSYTASLYLGLLSLLEGERGLGGSRVGFFSYGSGSVSEFFTGVVRPGYESVVRAAEDEQILARRVPVSYERYSALHRKVDEVAGTDYATAAETTGPFRFAGVEGSVRRYERRAA